MQNSLYSNLDTLLRALSSEMRLTASLKKDAVALRNELDVARLAAPRIEKVIKKEGAKRAAVISWDMGHNPVGRAYVLYRLLTKDWNPTLIGPGWKRYGGNLWGPLRQSNLDCYRFTCETIEDYYPQALLAASQEKFDLVYVCKPRLPSLFLGLLIKQNSNCPLVLDVDDHELSFFDKRTPADFDELVSGGPDALIEPFGELATRYCEKLIPTAGDVITVSNVSLREKFGGTIVRHARDEFAFKLANFDRDAIRKQLGVTKDEFVLMFIGTARAHKGISVIAEALDNLNDPLLSLHIVGGDLPPALKASLDKCPRAKIVLHPPCPFEDLPKMLAAADCVPLLQDPTHPVSEFQIPAKISDAASLGIPILTTEVPPIRDLIDFPGLIVVTPATIAEELSKLRKERSEEQRARIRTAFLAEFSEEVNASRLRAVINDVQTLVPAPNDFDKLREQMGQAFKVMLDKRAAPPIAAPAIGKGAQRRCDIALFWKQNDSGLYGRRADMLAKYFVQSGRFDRLMFFDAPLPINILYAHSEKAAADPKSQSALILKNTIGRWEKRLDRPNFLQRSFIHCAGNIEKLAGVELPQQQDFPDFVLKELTEAGFDPANTIAWVCPVIWGFADVAERVKFKANVVDLIDDQRAWNIKEGYRKRLDEQYRQTLGLADAVFTNCQPVADAFARYTEHVIFVVPNGAERFDKMQNIPLFAPNVRGGSETVIGYVGNLRDRIDWSLLSDLVKKRPDWKFVFAGPADNVPDVEELAKFPNVQFLGVVEYNRLPSLLKSFDVGIVPHTLDDLTGSMNPLKVYNYLAAGLPVVATDVPNVAELSPYIWKAGTADEFIDAVEASLAADDTKAGDARDTILGAISWEARASEIIDSLGSVVEL